MALNANEFILPGFGGGDPAAALQTFGNKLYLRNMQAERLRLAKEGKRQQAGKFLEDYLSPKDYLTGTAYDPVINQGLQAALQHGAALAEQGADIPQLLTQLGPMMGQITEYSTKAKAINSQIDNQIKEMRAMGYAGHDYMKVADMARKMAFHQFDPNTGQDVGLNEISKVDPSVNWVQRAIQEHPEEVTTAEGLDQYVKNYPQVKNSTDATTYTPSGQMSRNKVNLVGQGYLQPEVDERGVVTGLVPAYEHATDQGQPILHDFVNNEGKHVTAPVRLLDEGYFNEAVSHKGIGDWLRGQVKQHLNEYQTRTGQPIDMNSVQAHQVARAIMYDELKRRSPGSIQYQDVIGKPSAAQVQLNTFGDKRQQAYDNTMGKMDAYNELGIPYPGATKSEKPLNPIETIHQLFKNNENYLTGDFETINGHDVIDVTPNFKGGLFKFGKGQSGTYSHVYFDPRRRKLMLEDAEGGKIVEQGEQGLKEFAKKIAAVNNVNPDVVDPSFRNAGYNNKNQTYSNTDLPAAIQQRYTDLANEREAKINKSIDDFITNKNWDALKGIKTPQGKITDVSSAWYGGKYKIEYKDKNGTTQVKRIKDKAELEQFIKGTISTSQPATAVKSDSTSKKEPSDIDLINKYR